MGDSLKEIGRRFQMEKYSYTSSIIERMKKQMLIDSALKRRVDRVERENAGANFGFN